MSIHPDIPEDRAWRDGRRIYVSSGYKSQLSEALWAIGANWDRQEKCLWVGSGKLEQVIPLILAQEQRAAAVQATKELGLWVRIPFDAAAVREQAKKLGGKWDAERKQWAMPSQSALDEVAALIAALPKPAPKAKAAPELSEADVLAASGRTVAGERGSVRGRLDGRGRRDWAEQAKPQPGEVRLTTDGRRVLVLSCTVGFMSENDIEDQMPGQPAGWYYTYRAVPVAPTAEEQAQDAAKAERAADGAAIAATFAAARAASQPAGVLDLSAVRGPSVTISGSAALGEGRITLTADGEVIWQHPGHYDDYRCSEGRTSDPGTVAAVRAIIAGGTRTRAHDGREYKVAAGI